MFYFNLEPVTDKVSLLKISI